MKLWIDNIGIVKNSELEINGLTVITGYNNSGKTTVGKVLYSLISAVEDLQKSAIRDKANYAKVRIDHMLNEMQWWYVSLMKERREAELNEMSAISAILQYIPATLKIEDLENCLHEILVHIDKIEELLLTRTKNLQKKSEIEKAIDGYREVVNSINKVILQDQELVEYANAKLDNTLKQEFNHQILPVGIENVTGKVALNDDSGNVFDVLIDNNEVVRRRETYTPIFGKEVIFIDNVFILDELAGQSKTQKNSGLRELKLNRPAKREFLSSISGKGHNSKLTKELLHKDENLFQEILNKRVAKEIFDKLNTVFDDEITITDGEVICAKSKIDIRNLAMGAKMFAMLKTLLENGSIKENTVLILDEPEVHLHPEWQNILAELLVLLQYQMGVTVLLTTHSSQFLMAIETFAKKYCLGEKFKVYATIKNTQDKFVTYQDVTDTLKDAYYRLARPMFEMKAAKDELER